MTREGKNCNLPSDLNCEIKGKSIMKIDKTQKKRKIFEKNLRGDATTVSITTFSTITPSITIKMRHSA